MTDLTIIDTRMHGHPGITGAFLVRGEKTALVETGPKSTVEHVFAGLEEHEVERLDWIVLTHIHLDHAGAAGTIARRFPEARVAVHEVGAPHLVDPAKLWKSAGRIYGDDMERLWGGIDPIPQDRIEVLRDGDVVDLGGRTLQAFDTPGHAFHHHAFLDDATGTLFAGDALGVRLPDVGFVRPATPPPEFNLELGLESIARIKELAPRSVCLTHFGPNTEGVDPRGVEDLCDEAAEALVKWAAWVHEAREQTEELDQAAKIVAEHARAAMEDKIDERQIERLEQTTSYWMNTWGYMRYLDKKQQAEA
ncbi:MAG: MBL fold metallo-hydrolase [Actinomycetota bacterium]